jgi:predicted nucleic acid-binding protein
MKLYVLDNSALSPIVRDEAGLDAADKTVREEMMQALGEDVRFLVPAHAMAESLAGLSAAEAKQWHAKVGTARNVAILPFDEEAAGAFAEMFRPEPERRLKFDYAIVAATKSVEAALITYDKGMKALAATHGVEAGKAREHFPKLAQLPIPSVSPPAVK